MLTPLCLFRGFGVVVSLSLPVATGIPIEKALDDYTMLAWEMNGETLPSYHGFPLRHVVPGYPGLYHMTHP